MKLPKKTPTLRPEPYESLFRIQRGLSGYISYLAACEVNTAFSEYVLYEPILRILMSRGYAVRCEYPCPGIVQPKRGDRKKVDFEASKPGGRFALEVKWTKSNRLSIEKDRLKLAAFRDATPGAQSFLCVFGRHSDIADITLSGAVWAEAGSLIHADFIRTKYGCRIYELRGAGPAGWPQERAVVLA